LDLTRGAFPDGPGAAHPFGPRRGRPRSGPLLRHRRDGRLDHLTAEPPQRLDRRISASPEQVVKADVLSIELVVDPVVGLDGLIPLVAEPRHSPGSLFDRGVSAGSFAGRDCRDAFLGLAKTCAKLGIAFWDYLGARLLVPGSATIPFLPEIVSVRAAQPP